MKKIFTHSTLCGLLFLFITQISFAQAPIINAQTGFPVGQKQGRQIEYGNGFYLLLGASNTFYQSGNGSSWTRLATTGTGTTPINQMAYGNGVFVVVGNSGIIKTSVDGINWTDRTSGTANNLLRVYYINSSFFALGLNRTLLKSADGITWTAIAFNQGNATDVLSSLAYGNGVYVIGASGSGYTGSRIYRSITAADNSWAYFTDAPVWGTMNRIQFLNDRFFCFMSSYNMYSSTDGITWNNFSASVTLHHPNGSSIAWGSGHQIFNGVWDGTSYHFYGSSQYYGGYGSTFTSSDLTNFTLLEKSAYIVPSESKFLNGKYFVCGNEGIVSSIDGLVYEHPGSSFNDMIKTANKFIAVGMIGQDGQIYNSTDFENWVNRTPSGMKELYAIASNGTDVLAAGTRFILRSADEGDSWMQLTDDPDLTITAMTFGNGKYIAGGYHNATGAFICNSTDGGDTWNNGSIDDNYYYRIKYANNKYFALGVHNSDYLGCIMYSEDGINWTEITPDLGMEVLYYKDVAWDGNKYHFMGVESEAYTAKGMFTVSATDPSISSSFGGVAVINNVPAGAVLGGSWDEGFLVYSNGRFTGSVVDVDTGQDYIIYSDNGSSWTAIAQNSYSSILAGYANANQVYMIGRSNAFFTASYSGILPVQYLSFNGSLQEKNVRLSWVTSREENSRRFVVQHSGNGRIWSDIGSVNAAGNSEMESHYSFLHQQPVSGNNYYRLQQEDGDGRKKTSQVVIVATANILVNIYPNPVEDLLHIQAGNPGRAILYNTGGQAIRSMMLQPGNNSMNLQGLQAGTYFIEIKKAGRVEKMTILKR